MKQTENISLDSYLVKMERIFGNKLGAYENNVAVLNEVKSWLVCEWLADAFDMKQLSELKRMADELYIRMLAEL